MNILMIKDSMNIKLSFLKNKIIKAGFWYTFGNILLKGTTFLTLPIFTRLLSTTDYGIFNTYLAYEAILSLIIGLGLHGSVKAAKYDLKDEFQEYLSSSISVIIIAFCVVLIGVNSIYKYIVHSEEFSLIIINVLIIHSLGSAIIHFVSANYVIEGQYKRFMALSCITTVTNILLSLIFCTTLFNDQRYIGRIAGNAIPFIIVGILLSISFLLKGRVLFHKVFLKYGLKIGLPLIPHLLSLTLLSQLDRIMIQKMIGYSEAGIYSFGYTMIAVLAIIMSSFDNAWGPWFYSNLSMKNYNHITKKNKIYVVVFTSITIGFMAVVPEVIKVIASPAYWDSLDVVIPLTVSVFLNYMYLFPVNVEYFYKKTGYISMGTIVCVGVNFVLNIIFIDIFGYKAAAYTTAASNLILFVIHWNIAKKVDENKIVDLKDLIFAFLYVLIAAVIIMLFKEYWYIRYSLILMVGLIVGLKLKSNIELS
jgi:O-antigen/teichoic acid export membrane protein